MDEGHEITEKLLKELEKRLKRLYSLASSEIRDKLKDYWKRFEAKNKVKLTLREGKIITPEVRGYAKSRNIPLTEKVVEEYYNYWLKGQIAIGKRWEEMRDTLAEDMHHVNEIAADMIEESNLDVYALNHNYGTYEIEKGALVNTSYTLYDRETVRRLVKDNPDILPTPRPENRDVRWNAQLFQSHLLQGILQGESIPKIAERVALGTAQRDLDASIRNARTATTGAENGGRVASYKRCEDMGIEVKKVWIATLDGRTRHTHRLLDGQKAAVEESFKVEGEKIKFPGDPSAPGHLVWNCRCTLIADVGGVDYDVSNLSNRNTDHLRDATYEEWKQGQSKPKHYGESVKQYERRVYGAKNNRS
ncbi:MAG: hypothetical protein II410_01845 [Ruminococcus sp.]|nr:hypothetical protein [Ruminococcus sp.]